MTMTMSLSIMTSVTIIAVVIKLGWANGSRRLPLLVTPVSLTRRRGS